MEVSSRKPSGQQVSLVETRSKRGMNWAEVDWEVTGLTAEEVIHRIETYYPDNGTHAFVEKKDGNFVQTKWTSPKTWVDAQWIHITPTATAGKLLVSIKSSSLHFLPQNVCKNNTRFRNCCARYRFFSDGGQNLRHISRVKKAIAGELTTTTTSSSSKQ